MFLESGAMFKRRGYFEDLLDHQKSVNVMFLERSNSNKSESLSDILFHLPWMQWKNISTTDPNIIICLPEHGSHINQSLITHITICAKFGDMMSMM